MRQRLIRCWCWPALLIFFALQLPGALVAEQGQGKPAFPDAHSRLVWLQDHGDGADSLARGENLVVMGLDSKDGLGERQLTPDRANWFKPLMTPDGQQVVVSNRKKRQMYLLDWQSGELRSLGAGVAVAVWEEPQARFLFSSKRVWVYCFVGDQPENKYGTAQPLFRFPLNNPTKQEPVWDKTMMAWSNLQLSRDGQLLGGLFPWPHGGVVDVKSRKFLRLGKGCWTSLSPDNSKLLWIFDGLHRNIQVHDVKNGDNWKVPINGAPGVGGFEVYHPRWSNHPRYFVITGPYEKGEGGNRIGGGGEKVEIYVGRFDAAVKKVEDWGKLTSNSRADFYPDLWIAGGQEAELQDLGKSEHTLEAATSWPVSQQDLLYLWEDMKSANQLSEESPGGFFQANLELRGKALINQRLQLVTGGGFGETGEAGKRIGKYLATSGQAAVEFVLTPEAEQNGALLTFSVDAEIVVSVRQDNGELQLVNQSGEVARFPEAITAQKRSHYLLQLTGKEVALFRDGKSVGSKSLQVDWTSRPVNELIVGDRQHPWNGTLEGIAVYRVPLDEQVVAAHAGYFSAKKTPAAPARLKLQATLDETTEVPAPDSLGAYRRALVVNIYRVDQVIQGSYSEDRVAVAEWAVLDRQVVLEYAAEPQSMELTLERYDDHPELEGERQLMDVFDPDLETWYRLPAGW